MGKGGGISGILNCCSISTKCDKSFLMYLVTCSCMFGKLCYINIPVRSYLCFCSKQNSVTYWICGILKSVVVLTMQGKVSFHFMS